MTKNNFDFNHRIILQKEIETADECGSIINSFETIMEVWAKITPIDSYQTFSRMKEDSETTHIIEVRYSERCKECKKILFGARIFYVIGFYSPYENKTTLIFNVKERL